MPHKIATRNDSGGPLRLDLARASLLHLCAQYGLPDGEVSLLVTIDKEMQKLNRVFRGVDEATDVLTFPAPPTAAGQIGDIAVSVEFARRQAEARGVPIEDEVAMLAIHGGLHLAGYDDETPAERDEMVRLMNEVAEACGVAVDPDWSSLPHGGTG